MAMTGPVPMKPSMVGIGLEGSGDRVLLLRLVGVEADELG